MATTVEPERVSAEQKAGFERAWSQPTGFLGVFQTIDNIPIAHRYLGAPAQPSWDDLREVLAPLFADSKVRKVAYDLKREDLEFLLS